MRQFLANSTLALWILFDGFRTGQAAWASEGAVCAILTMVTSALALNAFFVLRRPAPAAQDTTAGHAVGVFAAALCPLLWQFAPTPPTQAWGSSALLLEALSALLFGWSVWTLGSSFSLLPQVRNVVMSGPYAFVRHPIYASCLLLDLGYALAMSNPLWLMLWTAEFALLRLRCGWEERILCADSRYTDYARRVHWRFVPGLL